MIFFFLAWIAKEPLPEPGSPINRQILSLSVVMAEALNGNAPFLGKMKFDNLKRDFFIYPANCVPRMEIL